MKKVVLILFSFAEVEEVIERSFELAVPDGELYVVGVVEEEVPGSLTDLIANLGFLGGKVTDDVKSTIITEYKERARRVLDNIMERSKCKSCQTEVELLFEDSLTKLEKKLIAEEIDHLLVNYTNDQFISEEVLNYPLDELLEQIEIPYEVYFDGELSKQNK